MQSLRSLLPLVPPMPQRFVPPRPAQSSRHVDPTGLPVRIEPQSVSRLVASCRGELLPALDLADHCGVRSAAGTYLYRIPPHVVAVARACALAIACERAALTSRTTKTNRAMTRICRSIGLFPVLSSDGWGPPYSSSMSHSSRYGQIRTRCGWRPGGIGITCGVVNETDEARAISLHYADLSVPVAPRDKR